MNNLNNYCTFSELKTPCYVVDGQKLVENINNMRHAFENEWGSNVVLGYSVKTNHLSYLLQHAKSVGLSAEVVSGDEYKYTLSLGFTDIIYNGPQRDSETLVDAINRGFVVNIDNFYDLEIIENNLLRIDKEKSRIGIRVNFDIESICKEEIFPDSGIGRFGLCAENGDFERALKYLKKLTIPLRGLHMHVSSRSRGVSVFKALAAKAVELIQEYKLSESIVFIDLGGGFWGGKILSDKPTMEEYSRTIANELRNIISPLKVKLILEPGISIIASTVDYYTKVMNVRYIRGTVIITVDGSVLHVNPLMSSTQREFSVETGGRNIIPYQIVCGSTCMEKDRLLRLSGFPEIKKGDIIKFPYIGAYSMSFNNCFINCPPRIYAKTDQGYRMIRDKSIDLMSLI